MFMSSISLDSSPATAVAAEPGTAAGAPTQDGGGDFAQRLSQALTDRAGGQDLAAGGDALQALAAAQAAGAAGTAGAPGQAGQAATALAGLQTLSLGPTLELVTSSETPDGDSLAKFAKAQGLDDEVVAWLFADPSQQAAPLQAMLPMAQQMMGLTTTPVPTAPVAPAATDALLLAGGTAGTPLAPAVLSPQAADLQAAQALLAETAPAAGFGLAGWLNQQQAAGAGTPAATDAASGAEISSVPMAPAPVLPVALEVAQAPETEAQPRLLSQATAAIPTEILNLEVELEPLELPVAEELEPQHPHGLHAGGERNATGVDAGPEDVAPASTAAQRADDYEELSQRLGETLAKRLLSQIERGQWQVRLLLKPARLGEVEVSLKMNGGQLDAAFLSTNQTTRDLLNDGLPRLREVLAEAGMDIADLNVGAGRSQAGGGNPTPRQAAGQAAATAATATPSTSMTEDSTVTASAPRRNPNSAWDVLV